MKLKNLLVILICITVSSILIWLLNSPTPHLRSFVSKTQLQFKNINSKLQVLELEQNNDANDDDNDEHNSDDIDTTFLQLLGFVKNPKLFTFVNESKNMNSNNNNEIKSTTNLRIPPIVTAFYTFNDEEKLLIGSKMKYFPKDLFIIYDLDLR
jgi:hypothetical protein